MASWWAKSSWTELRLGGPYELYLLLDNPRALQGSEDCRILSYRPPEMLSFTWNFPPTIPEIRNEHTWVVVRFARRGPNETPVELDQLGWKSGSVWEAGWKYFDDVWERVLEIFRDRFPASEAAERNRRLPEIARKD
jgi:uncharacterized protein YndB with AHSA1/START domain